MENEKEEVLPGISNVKVKIVYGKQSINEILKMLIIHDIEEMEYLESQKYQNKD